MYIEDDPDDQEFFMDASHEVRDIGSTQLFSDGMSALSHLANEKQRPDIIFLDLNMPQLDGFEFLKRKNAMESVKDIPVIILTTSNDKEMEDRSYQSGATSFVTKPITIERLTDELRDSMNKVFGK